MDEKEMPLREGVGKEKWPVSFIAITNNITKGVITTTLNIETVFPTGEMPKILSAAPIQMIARQTGIFTEAIWGKKKEAYSTKSTG